MARKASEWPSKAEEELELNGKAMGAVIGKGGKGIKEIEQATGGLGDDLLIRKIKIIMIIFVYIYIYVCVYKKIG